MGDSDYTLCIHPRLLAVLHIVFCIMAVYHERIGSWMATFVAFYVESLFLSIAYIKYIYYLKQRQTWDLTVLILAAVGLVGKIVGDFLLSAELDGHSSIGYRYAIIPHLLFLAALFLGVARRL